MKKQMKVWVSKPPCHCAKLKRLLTRELLTGLTDMMATLNIPTWFKQGVSEEQRALGWDLKVTQVVKLGE